VEEEEEEEEGVVGVEMEVEEESREERRGVAITSTALLELEPPSTPSCADGGNDSTYKPFLLHHTNEMSTAQQQEHSRHSTRQSRAEAKEEDLPRTS